MSAFGKFKMNRTTEPVDVQLQEQEEVVIEKQFSGEYRPNDDSYQQVLRGN
jgi:hypothetical protein